MLDISLATVPWTLAVMLENHILYGTLGMTKRWPVRKHARQFVRREAETHCNSKTRRAGLGRVHVLTDEVCSRVDEIQTFAFFVRNEHRLGLEPLQINPLFKVLL